jgi:hypothetical protein
MTEKKIYVRLLVYNYDSSPRCERHRYYCLTREEAFRIADHLRSGISPNYDTTQNRTGGWLDRKFRIYGFVDSVEGVFEETTVELEEES